MEGRLHGKYIFEDISDSSFTSSLKNALEKKSTTFRYINKAGIEETYNIQIVEDVSEIEYSGNIVATFDMYFQNTCVRLKHTDIFKTTVCGDCMNGKNNLNSTGDDKKTTNVKRSSSDNESIKADELKKTIGDLLNKEEGVITIEVPSEIYSPVAEDDRKSSKFGRKSSTDAGSMNADFRSVDLRKQTELENMNGASSIESVDVMDALGYMAAGMNNLDINNLDINNLAMNNLDINNQRTGNSGFGSGGMQSNTGIRNYPTNSSIDIQQHSEEGMSDIVKCIKSNGENVIIHITIPDKSQFEVVLHQDKPNKGALSVNNDVLAVNSNVSAADNSVSSTVNNNTSVASKVDENLDTEPERSSKNNTIEFDTSSSKVETAKSSIESETKNENSSEFKIDSSEMPSSGKVKEMIDFFENVAYE